MLTTLTLICALAKQDALDPKAVGEKLATAMKAAKGLSYSFESTRLAKGVLKPFMKGSVRVMRPNMIFGESEQQCWYSDGKTMIEFFPKDKEYAYRPLDATGIFLPLGTGLHEFSAPSAYKQPKYNRATKQTFEGKPTICLEFTEPEIPGLVMKIYLNPETYVPQGWEQITGDSVLKNVYSKVDLNSVYPPSLFIWTPPKDAVDMAKVKRVSKLIPVGKPAPMFEFKDPNGKKLNMKSVLAEKKALVINFWYYGCGWCQKEFPELNALYKAKKSKGLEIMLINSGADSNSVIKSFLKASKLPMPVATDGANAVKAYGVEGFPATFLINPKGEVVYVLRGYSTEGVAKLTEEIEKLGLK